MDEAIRYIISRVIDNVNDAVRLNFCYVYLYSNPFGALNLIIGNFCNKQHVKKFPKQFLIIRELFNIIYSIKVP